MFYSPIFTRKADQNIALSADQLILGQPPSLGRALDGHGSGRRGMVSMVNSEQEAKEFSAAAVYAPDGTRGMAAGIVRATPVRCE